MGAVIQIPVQSNVEVLWERYSALIRERQDNPDLLADRIHSEATVRAWRTWSDAFQAWDGRC
ncbi:hypothetical protein [Sphingomonas sp.]|uniref:hypothetical protein n=1 Tax=Sphingomonas sp. TaxID=28214 RepID=UPI0035A88A5C